MVVFVGVYAAFSLAERQKARDVEERRNVAAQGCTTAIVLT